MTRPLVEQGDVIAKVTGDGIEVDLAVGREGPQGPQGPIGPPGPPPQTVIFTGQGAGQTVRLPGNVGGFALLIINGLVESPLNYSTAGAALSIPAGLVWDGAPCTFYFTLAS